MSHALPMRKYLLPIGDHPGCFGYRRKREVHSGIDLYCVSGTEVFSLLAGQVVYVGPYTGLSMGSPWWKDTDCVIVKSNGIHIVYGELRPEARLARGQRVEIGQFLGWVSSVTEARPTILGHTGSMLHLEYWRGQETKVVLDQALAPIVWPLCDFRPAGLVDPTVLIFDRSIVGSR